MSYSNSAYGGNEHEKLVGRVDTTYNYTKQNHQSEHYHDAEKINSRSVIYPNQRYRFLLLFVHVYCDCVCFINIVYIILIKHQSS